MPIIDIDMVKGNDKEECDDDHTSTDRWEEVKSLNSWRGTVAGCNHNNKILKRVCSSNNENGAAVAA